MKDKLQKLIKDIESEVHYTSRYIGKNELDSRVMEAMKNVPREQFVPEHLQAYAFDNGPLPIGYSQTISQPYIVALMSDLLMLKPEHKVLEIGTGSGYQTAVLSQLCDQVFTIELIRELSEQAEVRFHKLNYDNISCRVGNGYHGWPEQAPYDSIIVTAAASYISDLLTDQLKAGGNLVIPVGAPGGHQDLMLIKKDMSGKLEMHNMLGVAFVPLIEDKAGHTQALH